MKYRVLHILYSLNMGGAENFIMNIYRNIDRKRIQFDFLVHKKDYFDQEVKNMGGKIYYLDGYVTELGISKYKKKLQSFFNEGDGSKYKIVHVHVNQTSGLIIPIIKRTTSAICFSHCHDLKNYNNIFVSLYKKYLQFNLNRYVDYRLACSFAAGKWLYGKKSFSVINNAINISKFKFSGDERKRIREQLHILEEEVVLGHVGRFERVKNQKFLVELFQKMFKKSNYRLVLIGDGSMKEFIQQYIDENELTKRILLLPATSDIAKYYSAMDIFVLPSIDEALGIVGIEAQANGLPVLASTGVVREMKVSQNVRFAELNFETWKMQIDDFVNQIVSKNIDRKQACISEDYDINKSTVELVKLYDEGVKKFDNSH